MGELDRVLGGGLVPGSVTVVGGEPGIGKSTLVLVRMAKSRGIATLIVGHVTKDGTLAGPRTLEHIVDTVLSFEGDRHHALRLLHVLKHRFGDTSELGLFEMTERGLAGVADPSTMFLTDRRPGAPTPCGRR